MSFFTPPYTNATTKTLFFGRSQPGWFEHGFYRASITVGRGLRASETSIGFAASLGLNRAGAAHA